MALPATDNFNRANSTDIGTNWTPQSGSFELVSNAILPNGASAGTEDAEFWNADAFDNDQYSQVVVTGVTGVAGSGACVRCNTGTTDSWYGFYGYTSASFLFKMVSGTWTQLGANAAAFANTDVVRIEAEGTTITGKIDGVTARTATDSSLSSGAAGVTGWGDNSGTVIDDWEGGNLGAAPASLVPTTRSKAFAGLIVR